MLCIPPRTAQSNFEPSPPPVTSVCILTLFTYTRRPVSNAEQSSNAVLALLSIRANDVSCAFYSQSFSLCFYPAPVFSLSALLALPNAYAIISSLIGASPTTTTSRISIANHIFQYALQYCVMSSMRPSRSPDTS